MASNEVGGKSVPEGLNKRWRETISGCSGYGVWLLVCSILWFLLVVAGVILIRWALESMQAREASLALGFGLATWGWVLMLVTGVAVFIKASTNPADQHI